MSEGRELEARVVLGLDAEAFLASNVGRYMRARAEEEIENARMALETVSPVDAEAIRSLQFVVAVARATTSWLQEAIADGQNAAEQLVVQNSND